MTDVDSKLCPLLLMAEVRGTREVTDLTCQREKCAWWMRCGGLYDGDGSPKGMCAVLGLAA
jgi:hypothetical protein